MEAHGRAHPYTFHLQSSSLSSSHTPGGQYKALASRKPGRAGDLPPLRPAWRLACIPVVHQLCRGLESPNSSAKGVGPVWRQGQDLGMEGAGHWPGWPIWE